MENASKALIIAGAILISILIIALGVFVFNQAKGVMGNVNMESQGIETFNEQFLQYQGKQSGSNAIALLKKIDAYNKTVNDGRYIAAYTLTSSNSQDATKQIDFVTSDPGVYNGYSSSIKIGKNYTISFNYNKAGYVTRALFKEE